jgi:hypothetical protein
MGGNNYLLIIGKNERGRGRRRWSGVEGEEI